MNLTLKGCTNESSNFLLAMDHDSGYVEGCVSSEASSNQDDSSETIVLSVGHVKVPEPPYIISEDALLETPQLGSTDSCFARAIDNEDYAETRRQFFTPDKVINSSVTTEKSNMGLDGLESVGSSVKSTELPIADSIVTNENHDNSLIDYKHTVQDADSSINHTLSDMSLDQSMYEPIILEQTNYQNIDTNLDFTDMSVDQTDQQLVNNISVRNNFDLNIDIRDKIETKQNTESTDVNMTSISATDMPHIYPEIHHKAQVLETSDCLQKTEILKESPVLPNSKRQLKSEFVFESPRHVKKLDSFNNLLSPKEKCKSHFIFGSPQGIIEKIQKTENAGNLNSVSPKAKRRLTLVFSKAEKENNYMVKRKYPSMTPEKKVDPIDPNISPDLFSDDNLETSIVANYDECSNISMDVVNIPELVPLAKGISRIPQLFSPNNIANNERFANSLDRRILLRVQKGLSGVLPPPNMTVVNLSVTDILSRLEGNKAFFWDSEITPPENLDDTKELSLNSSGDSNPISKSLLVNTDDVEGLKGGIDFPEILEQRYHGVHYNHSKISEEIANLCDKYAKRFVGAETQSSCTVFEQPFAGSPSKRKAAKAKWGTKSPGRRLSHLARRRITFSSANLQAGGSSLAGSRARQILVDARKMELLNHRKSPKKTPKKTPSKSPRVKTRTPSSSAKKKLALRFRKVTGEIEKSSPSTSETMFSKRALFKSPDKAVKSKMSSLSSRWSTASSKSPSVKKNVPSMSDSILAEPDRSQLRRALFTSPRKDSPSKNRKSPFKKIFGAKRKRAENEEDHPSKFPRSMSCLEVQSTSSESSKVISRTRSDVDLGNRNHGQMDLNDLQRKKLQWAVYEALRSQNIQPGHPQFKVFAAVLARVTRRFFNSLMNSSPSIGSTTDRMLRIAKHHVFAVIKGKTSDEIVGEHLKARARFQKPQGYVAPLEEVNNAKNKEPNKITSGSKPGVLQDRVNTIESWEKKKLEQLSKPNNDSKIERIRKVINFGDDR